MYFRLSSLHFFVSFFLCFFLVICQEKLIFAHELYKKKGFYMAATVLNDAQIDILNMMRWVKSDETLNDLKQAISDFFAKKAKEEMDAMWENGTMTQEKFDSFATLHERTPYRR